MQKFEQIVSLGWFCSTASELDRMGLRDTSFPFDWLGTPLQSIFDLIDNHFEDFLTYDLLYQNTKEKRGYKNIKYDLVFFHEFSRHHPLADQIEAVQEKYKRRIALFYERIKKPTLFLRYIENQEEAKYLENNYDFVLSYIKKFNENNEIVFVSNDTIKADIPGIHYVQPDEGDTVARYFLKKAPALQDYLCSGIFPEDRRKKNQRRYNKKHRQWGKRFRKWLKKIFHIKGHTKSVEHIPEYVHDKTVDKL